MGLTCLEAYLQDHPDMHCVVENLSIPPDCPSHHGYLDDPTWCDEDGAACRMCWEREIPEEFDPEKEYEEALQSMSKTLKKENENMSDISERTDPVKCETCDLDYKAEWERLKVENEKLKMGYEALTRDINRATERLEQYRFIIKTVEAMCGRDILEDF